MSHPLPVLPVGAAPSLDRIRIAWAALPTPLGALYVAASPLGVLCISTAETAPAAFAARLAADLGPWATVVRAPTALLDRALEELSEYFAGRRRVFGVPLDRRLLRPGFYTQALTALGAVPWGHLVSYGELARRAGSPRAARAAGAACASNPLSILIPCHRVVPANGGIGGYGGGGPGIAYKRALLAIEGVVFPAA